METNETLIYQYNLYKLTKEILENEKKLNSKTSNVPIYLKIIATIFYFIITFLSIGGNLLVILITNSKKIKTVTNFFIMILAISDILFIFLCIPSTYISYIYEYWILGEV